MALRGGQSDTGQLRRVILKHPRDAWASQEALAEQWRSLNYLAQPDLPAALEDYDRFAGALESAGVDLLFLPADPDTGADSLYPRDTAVICERGAILCSMGKDARRGEPAAVGRFFESIGIEVIAEVGGGGLLEGGDVVWLGPRLLAAGQGYRTNAEGIRQLREALGDAVDEVITVPLPHWHGPGDVFHLMSMISPLDSDLAIVYSPLLPVPFRQRLLELGIGLVEVAETEFATQGCNVLALAPRVALLTDRNPLTRQRLEAAGVDVVVYPGAEISIKGGGGPTCLTRTLERY